MYNSRIGILVVLNLVFLLINMWILNSNIIHRDDVYSDLHTDTEEVTTYRQTEQQLIPSTKQQNILLSDQYSKKYV